MNDSTLTARRSTRTRFLPTLIEHAPAPRNTLLFCPCGTEAEATLIGEVMQAEQVRQRAQGVLDDREDYVGKGRYVAIITPRRTLGNSRVDLLLQRVQGIKMGLRFVGSRVVTQ